MLKAMGAHEPAACYTAHLALSTHMQTHLLQLQQQQVLTTTGPRIT